PGDGPGAGPGPEAAAAEPLVPPWVDPDGPARAVLPALVRLRWRRLDRRMALLGDDPPDDDLHEVRILAKRLRYAAEAVAPVVGRAAGRTGRDAARLQGVLGDHHDAVVAEAWLREAARRAGGGHALVFGQLIAGERQAHARARAEWQAARAPLTGRRRRAWLR
ncbi:MAG: CHAD domain-containing protein, partial [Acidimicrobiales bacterium]